MMDLRWCVSCDGFMSCDGLEVEAEGANWI